MHLIEDDLKNLPTEFVFPQFLVQGGSQFHFAEDAAQHGDRVSSVGDNDFFSGTDASNPGTRVRVKLSN